MEDAWALRRILNESVTQLSWRKGENPTSISFIFRSRRQRFRRPTLEDVCVDKTLPPRLADPLLSPYKTNGKMKIKSDHQIDGRAIFSVLWMDVFRSGGMKLSNSVKRKANIVVQPFSSQEKE